MHSDVAVTNCTFDTGPGSDLQLWDVDGGFVGNNTALRCSPLLDPSPFLDASNSGGTVQSGGNDVKAESNDSRLCMKQQQQQQQ